MWRKCGDEKISYYSFNVNLTLPGTPTITLTLLYVNFPIPGTPTITLTLLYVNLPIPNTSTITLTLLYVTFPISGTPTITLTWFTLIVQYLASLLSHKRCCYKVSFSIQIARMCSQILHGALQIHYTIFLSFVFRCWYWFDKTLANSPFRQFSVAH